MTVILTFLPSEFLPSAKAYTEIFVEATEDARPYIEWGQVDNGSFRALANGSYVYTSNANPSSRNNPVPSNQGVRDRIDMRNYRMPSVFVDPLTNKRYPASEVIDKKLDSRNGGVSFDPNFNGDWYKGENIRVDGDYHVALYVTTGSGYTHREKFVLTGPNGRPLLRPNGWEKYAYRYHIPMKVKWVGKIRIYDEGLKLQPDKAKACVGDIKVFTPTLTKISSR